MVISIPATVPGSGPRPVNLNTDIPQLIELLQLVFREEMQATGQRLVKPPTASSTPAVLWRLNPSLTRLAPGFVWEVDGRVIGNVTLLPTELPRRYLVANVAVHPDLRRQGIARQLMHAALNEVQRRGGREVLLQVVKSNAPAIALYLSMDFVVVGSMTNWRSSVSRLRELPLLGEPWRIEPLPARRWREAYQLDTMVLHPDLQWPEPLEPDAYRRNFWRRLSNFFSGRQSETWMAVDEQQRMVGLGRIDSEWARAHELSIRVHPLYQGRLERPVLAKLVRRLGYLARRNVHIAHPDSDEEMNRLLSQAGFQVQRTLTHMRLDLR